MVKYGNRRKAETAVGLLACIGVVLVTGILFYTWVVVMACM